MARAEPQARALLGLQARRSTVATRAKFVDAIQRRRWAVPPVPGALTGDGSK
jgi:hypothetical protein